jgi:hypothetical protein
MVQEQLAYTELESEEQYKRSLSARSFFAQKQLLPTLRRPLITTLLSSLPQGIKKKADEYGLVLESSQLLLIYQGLVLSALQKLKQLVVEKETDLILEAKIFNKRLLEKQDGFKFWLEKEAKFYAQGLIVFHLQSIKLTVSDLQASNTDSWLAPECLLRQMQRVANIAPDESLNIIYFMMIKLCLDKQLQISIEGASAQQVEEGLTRAKTRLDNKEVQPKDVQRKNQWWSAMEASAEEYLNHLFTTQLQGYEPRAAAAVCVNF